MGLYFGHCEICGVKNHRTHSSRLPKLISPSVVLGEQPTLDMENYLELLRVLRLFES